MHRIRIENKALAVAVAPDYGARVVSLIDRASGREWMTQGGESANTGEDAVYLGDEAVGWDECFPTVGRWDAGATAWRRTLRDHGDLWGRPWRLDAEATDAVALTYVDQRFTFTRALRLDGASLVADYRVQNLTSEPVPYLWALHALLAVEAGDRMELRDVETVESAFTSLDGVVSRVPQRAWTERSADLPFALADVQSPDRRFMGKFYAGNMPGGSARVGRPGQWLELSWDKSIADLGIWLTYGAWPKPGAAAHQEVALEPTNASADHAGQAVERGAALLKPGEDRHWQVRLTVGA